MTSTWVRRTIASGAALALLGLAGCGGSGGAEEPQAGETAGASEETTAGSPTESPTESPSETPSETSSAMTPSAAPATGLRLETTGVAVHAPAGWEKYEPPVVYDWRKHAAEPGTYDTTLVLAVHTSLNPDRSEEERAQGNLEQYAGAPGADMKRAGTVMLDGVEFYQNIGRESREVWLYQYGAGLGNSEVKISIKLDRFAHPDRADRDEIVSSILASVEIDADAG